MPTDVMKTKTFTVLTNLRALLVSRNTEKNLKTIEKAIASATNYVEFSCFGFWNYFLHYIIQIIFIVFNIYSVDEGDIQRDEVAFVK